MTVRAAILGRLSRLSRCCAASVLALALWAIFGPAAQAGVIVEVGAADVAAASMESGGDKSPSHPLPPAQSNLSRLHQHALYGSGESSGPQSGSSTSSSAHGASAALSAANGDAARTGGQWRCVTELDEPRVLRGALDSIFHPPRGQS